MTSPRQSRCLPWGAKHFQEPESQTQKLGESTEVRRPGGLQVGSQRPRMCGWNPKNPHRVKSLS